MQCQTPNVNVSPNRIFSTSPCGQCLICRERFRRSWTARLLVESQEHDVGSFVTLSYAVEPQRFDAAHITGFCKRLRRNTQARFRYYCCGEHGTKNKRRHWHLILFGLDAPRDVIYRAWNLGTVDTSPILSWERSGNYVTKYMLKDEQSHFQMSRRPGLGYAGFWRLGERMAQMHPNLQESPTGLTIDGQHYPIHRKAKEWMERAFYTESGRRLTVTDLGSQRLRSMRVRLTPRGAPITVQL